ncbi:hypothetical protein D9926_12745 [Salmonella enterica]|nr:hypothetical protein [Salmonella enterica]MBA2981769.1 hypothetical protein [Salmonella enterica subsp. enterica serovar 9,12:l,z28:-]
MNADMIGRINKCIKWYKSDNAKNPVASQAHRDALIEDLQYLHDQAEDRYQEDDCKAINAIINYVDSGEEPNYIPVPEVAA